MYDQKCDSPERRQPTVRVALERLEKIAADSEDLVKRLNEVFSSVLLPHSNPSESASKTPTILGSDLGQALMRLSNQLETNFSAIRLMIESADV